MSPEIEINQEEEDRKKRLNNNQGEEKRKRRLNDKEKGKKKVRNKLGIYLGLFLLVIGIFWFAIDAGLIPAQYLDFWPQFLLIIIALIILIKSF